jgi:ribosome-binding protein aMBF1 (putative translation factor)
VTFDRASSRAPLVKLSLPSPGTPEEDLKLKPERGTSGARVREVRATLALNVRSLREVSGCSQADLASACELSRDVISRVERGQHEPRVSTLLLIADALGVTLPALLDGL